MHLLANGMRGSFLWKRNQLRMRYESKMVCEITFNALYHNLYKNYYFLYVRKVIKEENKQNI